MVQALQLLLNCTARLFKRRNWNMVFDPGASTTIFAIIWEPLFSFMLFQPPIMLFIIISSIFVKSRVVIVFYHNDFIMYEIKWKHFFQNSVSHHKYIIHSQNSFDTHFTWSWSSSNRLRWFHESQPWLFHLVIERNSMKCIIKYDYNIVNLFMAITWYPTRAQNSVQSPLARSLSGRWQTRSGSNILKQVFWKLMLVLNFSIIIFEYRHIQVFLQGIVKADYVSILILNV